MQEKVILCINTDQTTTQNAGKAHNLLQGPPSAPLISKYLFSLTWTEVKDWKIRQWHPESITFQQLAMTMDLWKYCCQMILPII